MMNPQQTNDKTEKNEKGDKTARIADLQRQIDHLVEEREKLKGESHGKA